MDMATWVIMAHTTSKSAGGPSFMSHGSDPAPVKVYVRRNRPSLDAPLVAIMNGTRIFMTQSSP